MLAKKTRKEPKKADNREENMSTHCRPRYSTGQEVFSPGPPSSTAQSTAAFFSADRFLADRILADRFSADRFSADRFSADRFLANRF
jgi:hypothetical protein